MAVLSPARPGLRAAWDAVAGRAADLVGHATGRVLAWSRTVPGIGGAAGLSVCAGELAGHVFGHGVAPWAGGLVGSVFLLMLDRRL